MIGLGDVAIATGSSSSTLSATKSWIFLLIGRLKLLPFGFASIPELRLSRAIVPVLMQSGIRQGTAEAVQVSDRWHLLRNLGDAVRATSTAITASPSVQHSPPSVSQHFSSREEMRILT